MFCCVAVLFTYDCFLSCFKAPKSPGTTRKENIGKNAGIELLTLKLAETGHVGYESMATCFFLKNLEYMV